MTTRPGRFWLGVLAALAIALWLLREILLPFVLGMVIGYLLDPLVQRLGRRGALPRRRGGRYGRLPERTRFWLDTGLGYRASRRDRSCRDE